MRAFGAVLAAGLLAAAADRGRADPLHIDPVQGQAAQAEPTPAPAAPAILLRPPVEPACVSSPFGPRVLPGLPKAGTFHNGIDLPAPAGGAVRAAAAGTIATIHRQGPGGMEVFVHHADGLDTLYAHLGILTPAIATGKRSIAAGEKIGVVGRSGVTYGTHLFFAVFRNGHAVDPQQFLGLPHCH